jgi:FKBP-type peptidyl-prolyl cis-trans isomerase
MRKHITAGLFLIAAAVTFFSCKDNSFEKQRKNELEKLNLFIRTHYAGMDPKPSGLYYIELEEGTGDSIKIGDRVQIFYDMWTLDSSRVASSGQYEPLELVVLHPSDLGYSATLPEDIRALHEALTYMKKNSKALLIFDSGLGFGQNGTYGIVGFTPLMMELEVYKVYHAQTQ